MKRITSMLALGTAFALMAPAAQAQQQDMAHSPDMDMRVEELSADWPSASQKALNHMVETYGPPAAMTAEMAIWAETGVWKRTVVFSEEQPHDFPMPHMDVMQQWVEYDVPVDMYEKLAEYDGSVVLERTAGEMSARCDMEGANFLALNLAHDIVEGNETVESARMKYLEEIKAMKAGNGTEYTSGLIFDLPEDTGFKDEPIAADSTETSNR